MRDVLVLTLNGDSFPLQTGIPDEQIQLANPKNLFAIKQWAQTEQKKLVVIDGCMNFESIVRIVQKIRSVRRRRRVNITMVVVFQDELHIDGAIWVQRAEDIKKYLPSPALV